MRRSILMKYIAYNRNLTTEDIQTAFLENQGPQWRKMWTENKQKVHNCKTSSGWESNKSVDVNAEVVS